jgi:hypothetical protein
MDPTQVDLVGLITPIQFFNHFELQVYLTLPVICLPLPKSTEVNHNSAHHLSMCESAVIFPRFLFFSRLGPLEPPRVSWLSAELCHYYMI